MFVHSSPICRPISYSSKTVVIILKFKLLVFRIYVKLVDELFASYIPKQGYSNVVDLHLWIVCSLQSQSFLYTFDSFISSSICLDRFILFLDSILVESQLFLCLQMHLRYYLNCCSSQFALLLFLLPQRLSSSEARLALFCFVEGLI